MACSSSYLRKSRQVVSFVSPSYLAARNCISIINHHHHRPLITTSSVRAFSSDAPAASKTNLLSACNNNNPWLMLTPEMGPLSSGVFKFYSLAEDKVITMDRKNLKDQLGLGSSGQGVELECKGSSHGWLALFDRCSSDLFLYNPLSARHLKLPTIRNLEAIRKDNLESGYGCVTKVILSSSDPEGDLNCRALMIHGGSLHNKLAFCCPSSSSSEWIETYQRYDDVVSTGDGGLFFGVNDSEGPYPEFEGWDLRDLSRPRLISLEDRIDKDYGRTFPWKGYNFHEPWTGREANFLVPAAADGNNNNNNMLFYVCLHRGDWDLKKMDIHVHKFDFEKRELVRMDGSLEGLALFVGRNHSFACLSGGGVKPDSIYFTHPEDCSHNGGTTLGRSRIEIYNYRDATFSPLFHATKKKYARTNLPVWYTPTHH